MKRMLIAAAAGIMLSAGLMPVAQADITASLQARWDTPPDELTSGDELVARVEWDANYAHGYIDEAAESSSIFELSIDNGYFLALPDQCDDGSSFGAESMICILTTPDDDGIAGHFSVPVRAWGHDGDEVAVSVTDAHGNEAETAQLKMAATTGIDISLNAAGLTAEDLQFRSGTYAKTLVPLMVAVPYGAAPLTGTVTLDLEVDTHSGPSVYESIDSLEIVPVPGDRRVIGVAANGPGYEMPEVTLEKTGKKGLRLTFDVPDEVIAPSVDPRGNLLDMVPVASMALNFRYPVYDGDLANEAISWTVGVTGFTASSGSTDITTQIRTSNDRAATSFTGIGSTSALFVTGRAPNAGGIIAEPGDDPDALPRVHREVWDPELGTGTLSGAGNHWVGRGPVLPGDQLVGVVNSSHLIGRSPSNFTPGSPHGYCLIFDRERGTTEYNGRYSVTGLSDYTLEYLTGEIPGGFVSPNCGEGDWTSQKPADVTAIRVIYDPAEQDAGWATRPNLGAGYLVAEDLAEGERAWMAGGMSVDVSRGWQMTGSPISKFADDPYGSTTLFRDAVEAVPSRTSVQLDTSSASVKVGERVDWEVTTRLSAAPFADRGDHTVERRLILPEGVEPMEGIDGQVRTEGGRTVITWQSDVKTGEHVTETIPTIYRFGTGTLTAQVTVENLTADRLTTDSDTAAVVALASAGAYLHKSAESAEFALDGSNRWTVSLENRDLWPIGVADTIDILPYEGDGRSTLTSADITVTNIGGGDTILVSTADPATLNPDPLASENGRIGTASAVWVPWKGQDDITAIRWITRDLGPGMMTEYTIDYTVDGATNRDMLVNSAQTRTTGTVTTMINSSSTTTVGAPADLQVDKRFVGSDAVLAAGEELTFEITAHGAGPGTVRGAVLTDVPVTGLKNVEFIEVSTGTAQGSIWRIGDLAEGEVVTATVRGIATGGPVKNMVIGDVCDNCVPQLPLTCEPNVDVYSDTDRCDVVTVEEEPILQVDKALIGDLPQEGPVSYAITVRNGAEAAEGRVTAGSLIEAADLTGVGLDPATVAFSELSQGTADDTIWSIGTLSAGEEATAIVTADVLPDVVRVVNAISVSSPSAPRELHDPSEAIPNDDVYSDTDQADVVDVARDGRLAINKELDSIDGEMIRYTIEVGNLGGEPIAGVTVTDIPGIDLHDSVFTEQSTGTAEGLTWDVGTLEVGQVETAIVSGRISPAASLVTNEVFAEAEEFPHGGTFIPNPTLETDTDQGDAVEVEVPVADLRLDKRVISIDTTVGIFEIEVCNVGLAPATGVTVTDLGGTNITSLTSEDERFEDGVFFLGTLEPGQCETLAVEADITGSGDNVAFVDSPNDPIEEGANQPNDSIEEDIDGWDIVEFEVKAPPVRAALPLTGPSTGALVLGSILLLGLGAGAIIATRRKA